ncbi:hypothetical protein [Oceanicella actignis]|uniref:hypothetical protein n=1 Tax=Oceanicella actignis TaxID=1189325 RepID=UPI000F73BAC0|nr:hypothetical protein [Oceanicella actignis]
MSKTTNRFSPEVRERAVRLVLDNEAQHPSVLYRDVWKFALGWGLEPLLGHAPTGAAHPGIPWSCRTTMEKREWTDGRIRRLRRSWNS